MNDYQKSDELKAAHIGESYGDFLSRLHEFLRPRSYLEIGSRAGDSLALASCPSIAIDPDFKLDPKFMGKKAFCGLYRMGSDEFFSQHDATAILGIPVDLAFLDGLHLAEFLLRDFINVERHCKRNSIVVIHDCLPLDLQMARRRETDFNKSARHPHWWTGDVWKVVIALKKYRPDLRIYALDASPTGLIVITCLDPTSSLFSEKYFDLIDEFRSMTSDDLLHFVSTLNIMSTKDMQTFEDISQFLWL